MFIAGTSIIATNVFKLGEEADFEACLQCWQAKTTFKC